MVLAKNKKYVLVALTIIIYVAHLALNSLAGKGGNSLFPRSVGNASRVFPLEMTPAGATFSIWGIIFTYTVIWQIYVVTTLFRNGDQTNILSAKFFLSFISNILFTTVWLFVWTRLEIVPSFIVIVLAQVFIDLTIGIACSDLADFLSTHPESSLNKVDVWCQRILVQNGLLFYASWTTVATLINTALVLSYELGLSTETASLMALSFLGVLLVTWFIVESFVLQKYTEYTLTSYMALTYALSGIMARIWHKNEVVGGLTLALLIATILCFIARLAIIITRAVKRSSYNNIGYNAKKQSVKS